MSILSLFSNPIGFFVFFFSLVISITIHEFSHVLAAYLQGDQTGKLMGRLSLNPIRHLDPFGTIMMVVVGIGWGKPAPFNPYNLRYRRWGPAFVALAGPFSNIVVTAVAGYLSLTLRHHLSDSNLLLAFLETLTYVSTLLFTFNLIPIHPLDGSHILQAVLGPTNTLVAWLQRYGFYLLVFILSLHFLSPSLDFFSPFIFGVSSGVMKLLGLGALL